MTRPKRPDLTGTARCGECGVGAVHEDGPGTPLVIRHLNTCSEKWKACRHGDLEHGESCPVCFWERLSADDEHNERLKRETEEAIRNHPNTYRGGGR